MIRDLRYTRRSAGSPKGRVASPRDLPPLSDYVPLDAAVRFLVDRFLTPKDARGGPLLNFIDPGGIPHLIQRLESRDINPCVFDSLLLDAELTLLPLFSAFLENSKSQLDREPNSTETLKKSRHHAKKLSDIL